MFLLVSAMMEMVGLLSETSNIWLMMKTGFAVQAVLLLLVKALGANCQKSERNKYGSNCIARSEKQYFWCPSDWFGADDMVLNAVWQLQKARWSK